MANQLTANQQLNVNDHLDPPNGTTRLIMQGDGNLVLYRQDDGVALWSTGTWNTPANHAIMQTDGNFVVYDATGKAYWATGTWTDPGSYVVLQDDGNFVLYGPNGGALWATNTVENWDPMTADTGDQNASGQAGFWMHSWASLASNGLISGHTHTWSTLGLKGFHGSVLPLVLDAAGMVIWPSDPDSQKHTYGVDGFLSPFGPHDRTDYWANPVDAATMANAKAIQLVNYYDPRNQLLNDLGILMQEASAVLPLIEAAVGG
jgi:hypothetical protein